MKKEILLTVNSLMRKAFARTMVVCALVVITFPLAADAQKFTIEKNSPEIKYLGTVQDRLLFQIDMENVPNSPLYVTIKDEEGNVLFAEKVRDANFSRKFAFDKGEFEGKRVSFIVQGVNGKSTQTVQVATRTRMVEDVVITRL